MLSREVRRAAALRRAEEGLFKPGDSSVVSLEGVRNALGELSKLMPEYSGIFYRLIYTIERYEEHEATGRRNNSYRSCL